MSSLATDIASSSDNRAYLLSEAELEMKSELELEDPDDEKALPKSLLRPDESSPDSTLFEDDVIVDGVLPRAMRPEGLGAVTLRTPLLEEKPLITSEKVSFC